MDGFELPDDLKDDVEVIYLDDADIENLDEENEDEMEEIIDGQNDVEVEDVVDVSKLTFSKHVKAVFSSDISLDGQLAVTGDENDMAYVWSINDGDVLFECTGHKDSVSEVAFNYNSQYVVTGDMGGLIQVWSVKDKKLVWCYEGDDLLWIQWHHLTNVLIGGFQSGDVYIWQIPQGNCKVLVSHGSPSTCGKLLPDGKQVLVGYSDGLKLWDIKSVSTIWQTNNKDGEEVNSIEINKDGTLVVVSPSAQLIKINDGKAVGSFLVDEATEIEVAACNSDLGIVVTGSLSGHVCVWDLARLSIRHQANINASVTTLEWGLNGHIFIGTTDGAVYLCDAKSGTLLETYTGHKLDILSICVTKDGKTLLTTSEDGTAKIFAIKSE